MLLQLFGIAFPHALVQIQLVNVGGVRFRLFLFVFRAQDFPCRLLFLFGIPLPEEMREADGFLIDTLMGQDQMPDKLQCAELRDGVEKFPENPVPLR